MTALRICFIGDSITAGTGDDDFLGWPALVCRVEQRRGHDVTLYNLGVRADTSNLIAARWRTECEARLRPGMPGALVFAFGVNDAAYEEGLGIRVPLAESLGTAREILTAAKAWLPTLWIGPIPIIATRQPFRAATAVYAFDNARIAEYNAAYARLARQIGVPYLDIFTPLSLNKQWRDAQERCDGVHPMHAGYGELAHLVETWLAWRTLWHEDEKASR